jgi:peptide/nickel transport system substrate-binding protein
MHTQEWRRARGLRSRVGAACAVAALALLAACGHGTSGGASKGNAVPAGGTKVAGGTATFALPPSSAPNYIFPFDSGSFFSLTNIATFQQLMYRPLYWFGIGSSPLLNASLSLASAPAYQGTQVTITMKGWKWSNGETVSADDVMFWLHMMQAVAPSDWGDYVPGLFPDNVTGIKETSPTTVTMTMKKAYNPVWFTSNELSQITPMPKAWDRTAAGPSDCTHVVADCAKVYAYLDAQSKALATWVTSPIWSVVDGPWKLSAFNPDGHSTFVPNPAYSGPVKPTLDKFQEVPFTTESAEYNVLRAGSAGAQQVDVGYMPSVDAPKKPSDADAGPNPVNGYTLAPLYNWAINYFPLNFQSTTGNGPVIKQLYFRQALQYLMNQKAVIDGPLRGYGIFTVGPVGSYPATPYLSPQGKSGDPFPFSPDTAKQLLTSHGWDVVPSGVTTCANPSLCGPGIAKGHQLEFNLPYATGTSWIDAEMTQLQSNASLVGIKLNLEPKPFNQVTAIAGPNCVVAKVSCNWDMANWGGGWIFEPDFYPSGETLYLSGAGSNSGGYSDQKNDAMIQQTLTDPAPSALYDWQDYLAKQVPSIWQPNGAYSLTEVSSKLRGVLPQGTTGNIYPENWYWVK